MESCFLRRSRDSNPHQPVLELRPFRSCVVPGRSRSTVSCPGHSLCEITSLTPLTAALPGRESRNSMTDKASPLSLHGTRRGPKKAKQNKSQLQSRGAKKPPRRAPTVNTGPALETRKQAQTFFHLSPWWSQGAQHPPPLRHGRHVLRGHMYGADMSPPKYTAGKVFEFSKSRLQFMWKGNTRQGRTRVHLQDISGRHRSH